MTLPGRGPRNYRAIELLMRRQCHAGKLGRWRIFPVNPAVIPGEHLGVLAVGTRAHLPHHDGATRPRGRPARANQPPIERPTTTVATNAGPRGRPARL